MDGTMKETIRKDTILGCWSRIKLQKFGIVLVGSGLEGDGRMRMGSVKTAVVVKLKEKGENKQVENLQPHVNRAGDRKV